MSSYYPQSFRLICISLAALLWYETSATAADFVWDGGTGSGTGWLVAANWAGDVVPGANDNAVFSSVGTASVVTIPLSSTAGGTQQVGCVTIDAGRTTSLTLSNSTTAAGAVTTSGYFQINGVNGTLMSNSSNIRFTITNGTVRNFTIALNASGEFYVGAGATNRLYVEIAEFGGSRSITKSGGGYLILNNTNSTYSGGTTNLAGTISVDQFATFGTGTGPLVLAGGDLRSENSRASTPIQNPIIMTADTTIYGNSTLATLRVFPLGGFITTTAGTLRVGNKASISGSTFELRLNGGGYNLTRPIIIGDASYDTAGTSSELGLNNTNTSGDQTISGNVSGQGFIVRGVTASANGSTFLTASNTYSGGTFIGSGTLFANNTSGSALGTGPVAITNGNGTLAGNGAVLASVFVATNSVGGNVAPGSLATNVGKLTVNDITFGENAIYQWNITAATGTAGVNWDLITASNSWADVATSVNPVIIKVDSLGTAPTGWNASTARDWTIIQSLTATGFDATHFAIDTFSFAGTISGIFALTNISGSLHLTYTPAADILINVPSGSVAQGQTSPTPYPILTGAVGVQKVGSGEVILTNPANNYQGTTKIYAGTATLAVDANNNSGAIGAASTPVLLGNSIGNSNATININTDTITMARPIQVQSGGTGIKTIGTALTNGTANYSGDIALQDNAVLSAAVGGTATFSGNITGSGGLKLAGGGTFTINGVNTYSGTTVISNGTFNFNSSKALGSNTVTFAASSATLDNTTSANITLNNNPPQNWNANLIFTGTTNLNLGAGAVSMSGTRTVTVNNSTLTVGGTISGNGGLVKLGAGTLLLAGVTNSTYTGGTTNSAGVLAVNATATFGDGTGNLVLSGGNILANNTRGNAPIANPVLMTTDTTIYGDSTSTSTRLFPMSGNWTVTPDTTLRIGNIATTNNTFEAMLTSGQNLTWPVIVGDPTFDTPSAISVLALYNNNTTPVQTVSSLITGNGGVRRGNLSAGAGGTTIFISDNTYSGGTVLDSGTIGIGRDSTPTSGVVTSGPLGTGTFEIVNDPSIFIFASGAARTIGNRVYLNGVTNTVFTGTNALTFTGDVNVGTVAKTLTVSNTAPVTFTGVLTNSALVSVAGNGVLILDGQNTFSGGLQLSSGSIGLGASSIASGGTVFSGPLGTGRFNFGGLIADASLAIFATTDSVTIDNNILFNGATNLVFAGTNNLIFTGAVNSGGVAKTLTVTNGITTTFSGAITNTGSSTGGSLTKAGGGTLVLGGNSTYTGSTTVNAGKLLLNNTSGSATGIGAVSVNSGAVLGGTGIIDGALTINANAILAPGNAGIGTLTVNSNLTLLGNGLFEVNKSASPSNDTVVVTGGIVNSGTSTITISNSGPVLSAGNRFTLFSAPVTNGGALTISGGGVTWSNRLAIDGSIQVIGGSVPNFQVTGGFNPGTYNFGFTAAAGQTFSVYSSTNVALPMAQWLRETDYAISGSQVMYETTHPPGDSSYSFTVQPPSNGQIFYRVGTP